MSTTLPPSSPVLTETFISKTLDNVRSNSLLQVASIELFGSTLPQILLFVQSRSESVDKFFTNGLEWIGQFPIAWGWNKLLKQQVFEPMLKPESLAPELRRTYDFGLTMASVLPIAGYIAFLPSLRNALRAKVLHQTSYVGAIGLHRRYGAESPVPDKEDEASMVQKGCRTFALGQGASLAAGLAFIPITKALIDKQWSLPHVDWHIKGQLPTLQALGKPYEALKASVARGVHLKPLELFVVKDGNLMNMTLEQEAWSGALPAYGGYLGFSQDKVEVGEILPRIASYLFAVPFSAGKLLGHPRISSHFEGKHYPIVGEGKNVQMLAKIGLSCLVYTGLPQAYSLLTRKKRAEKAGLLQQPAPLLSPSTPVSSPKPSLSPANDSTAAATPPARISPLNVASPMPLSVMSGRLL
ncbi:MAG: hypothetical protein ACKO34_06105 [Vampirovibrionales bacterium]